MPIGPYKTFDACIAAQRKDGKSLLSAQKICGAIEARTKKKEASKDWRHIEFIVPIQNAVLKDDNFLIRGIAINETTTRNNVKYIAEELQNAVPSLKGKPILKDHTNTIDSIVGVVTQNVVYNSMSKAVEFEGLIDDKVIQSKITKGLIKNVSVGAFVKDIKDKDETGAIIAKGIDFVELSLVAVPADPGASFAMAMTESLKLKKEYEEEDGEEFDDTEEDTEEKLKENIKMAEEFEDMASCMAAMMDKGHSKADASKKCTAIMGEKLKVNTKEEKMEIMNYEEKFTALKSELDSFKRELADKEIAKIKAEEQARILELENKAKMTEALQKELNELKAKASEKVESSLRGEVGTAKVENEYDNVIIGQDKDGLANGFVITRESYPDKLKNYSRNRYY